MSALHSTSLQMEIEELQEMALFGVTCFPNVDGINGLGETGTGNGGTCSKDLGGGGGKSGGGGGGK